MSLVMTPMLNSSRSHSHRRRTSMVLPEPTGPPMPRRTIRFLGDEEALISYFVLHGGDLHQRIEPAEFVATHGEGKSHSLFHAQKRCGESALRGILSDAQ